MRLLRENMTSPGESIIVFASNRAYHENKYMSRII